MMTEAMPHINEGGASVEICNLNRSYVDGRETVIALQDVSIDIPPTSFFTILGPSGCGKSTLLNILGGFDKPQGGSVTIDGRPINGPSVQQGTVFQDTAALFPWLTVAQNISFGPNAAGMSRNATRDIVARALELVSLSAFANRYPHQLSGGMRQLVAIARVVVMEPRLLLMDEPFAALDAITRGHLQEKLIEIWQRTRITVVFITHSVDEAILLSDEIAIMTPRPGVVRARMKLNLPRPRSVTSAAFNSAKEEALSHLFHESHKRGTCLDQSTA
jgi:NitT/TauT family transport system ATP-binding protein